MSINAKYIAEKIKEKVPLNSVCLVGYDAIGKYYDPLTFEMVHGQHKGSLRNPSYERLKEIEASKFGFEKCTTDESGKFLRFTRISFYDFDLNKSVHISLI